MSDLLPRIARAGRGIGPAWDEDDVDRVWRGIGRKRSRRRARLALAGTTAGLACVAALVVVSWRRGPAPASVLRASGPGTRPTAGVGAGVEPGQTPHARPGPAHLAPEARTLRFPDGSRAAPLGSDDALTVVEDTAARVTVNVGRGGGRFDVVHRSDRIFAVRAGDVTVTVLGTAFTVERVADRVGVTVARGRVLVDWGVGMRHLNAGDAGWFPPLVVASPATVERDGKARAAVRRRRRVVAMASASAVQGGVGASVDGVSGALNPDSSAAPGEEPFAVAASSRSTPPKRAEERGTSVEGRVGGNVEGHVDERIEGPVDEHVEARVEERGHGHGHANANANANADAEAQALLAAADSARLTGHGEQGATLLRRLVREHPTDPRAPLAAFSLGRLLLGELGRPVDAARAFARARALAPSGPLAEDALAREVEAWSRAEEHGRARARAEEYLRLYPSGRRAQVVRSLGAR